LGVRYVLEGSVRRSGHQIPFKPDRLFAGLKLGCAPPPSLSREIDPRLLSPGLTT
jgi:hypothetical protein